MSACLAMASATVATELGEDWNDLVGEVDGKHGVARCCFHGNLRLGSSKGNRDLAVAIGKRCYSTGCGKFEACPERA